MIQTLGRIKSVSSAFVYIEAGNIQVPASPILDTFATVIITAFRWWMSVDFLKTLDVALEEVMCLQQIFLQGHKPAPATFSHCTVSGIKSESHTCRILRGRTEPRCGTCCCTLWNQDSGRIFPHSTIVYFFFKQIHQICPGSCTCMPCGPSVCNIFLQEAPSNLSDLPREPLENKAECEE